MIEKREIKSFGGQKRLESLKNREKERFENIATKPYLDSLNFPDKRAMYMIFRLKLRN